MGTVSLSIAELATNAAKDIAIYTRIITAKHLTNRNHHNSLEPESYGLDSVVTCAFDGAKLM